MSEPAVVFDRVWKKFRRGERHDSLRDLLPSVARRLLRRSVTEELSDVNDFWAVQDVAFEVDRGKALGIIGPNGAGKSTILKLLTRILKPTRGSCRVNGKAGALIEVAAGFHPDLTGRENVFLQGAIMGMTRSDIAKRLDEIVEFSGTAAFIDTPVKRYSSGMNARLGFSIAAHLNPDVLIIDEVLAVGDVAFQQKCADRMREYLREGVALVFVSHNLLAVTQLCDTALLLDHGTSVAQGPSSEIVARFSQAQFGGARPNSTDALELSIRMADRTALRSVRPGESITFTVDATLHRPVRDTGIGIVVWDVARNLYVYGATSIAIGLEAIEGRPGDRHSFDFELTANLARGTYLIEVNAYDDVQHRTLALLKPAAQFTVAEEVTYNGVANLFMKGKVNEVQAMECLPS